MTFLINLSRIKLSQPIDSPLLHSTGQSHNYGLISALRQSWCATVYSGLGTSQSIIKQSQHHTTLTQDS